MTKLKSRLRQHLIVASSPSAPTGPRLCLGMNMAYLEAKLMVAMILQRFTFRVEPGESAAVKVKTCDLGLCAISFWNRNS